MKNFNQEWIKLLTRERAEKQREFEEILASSKSDVLAIMKYRRLEMAKGRGQDITIQDIKNVWNDDTKLREVLQELFLEPVLQGHIEYIRSKNINVEDIYNKHNQDKYTRCLSIALIL